MQFENSILLFEIRQLLKICDIIIFLSILKFLLTKLDGIGKIGNFFPKGNVKNRLVKEEKWICMSKKLTPCRLKEQVIFS
jgi:hypothetical protein